MNAQRGQVTDDLAGHLGRLIDEDRGLGSGDDHAMGPETRALLGMLKSEAAARQGNPEVARGHMEEARREMDSLPAGGRARLLCEARLELILGRRSVRAGVVSEARLHARRALAQVSRNIEVPATLRLASAELEAIVAIMTGAYDRAGRVLQGVTSHAEAAGAMWQVRAQRLLGAIHARRGAPLLAANAYRAAASRLDETEAPLEVAKLSSNLAMVSLMAGQVGGARAAIERALELRSAHGAPVSELANSVAVFALVAEREGLPEAAERWDRAVELSRQGPDAVLTAEIELRAAIAAAERGQRDVAGLLVANAEQRTARVGCSEPTLLAMAAEANARMQMVDGRWELARTSAKDALSGYSAIQASYHSARMELLIGRVERKSGHEVAARKRATHSTTLALRGRFELAWREDDLEFLRWAAESGELEVRRYCREFGVSLEGGTAVLIVDATGVIEAFGKMHELGASSIPFRLARALIAVSPRAITATELCRRLWPTTGLEPRTLNRLKVHLHRLREVLGEENGCVVTELSADRRASGTTYRWNPAVTARILSAGTRNRAGQRG